MRPQFMLSILLGLLLLAVGDRVVGQSLLPGEFGNIELDRELIEPGRFPTVAELRTAVAKPQIEHVLMLRLHASENNHHLPVWSHDGLRLAFQRSRIGTNTSQILVYSSLAEAKPKLISDEEHHYDYMFRWGRNHAQSYVFARIDSSQQSTTLIYSADGRDQTPLTGGGQFGYPALYERTDGIHWLAYENAGQLTHLAWQGEQKGERALVRGSSPRWSPDGRQLLYAKEIGRDGGIAKYGVAVRGLADNRDTILSTPLGAMIRSPSWSPQQNAAAFFMRGSGERSPWQIEAAAASGQGQSRTLVEDVVVNSVFKTEGPSWEPSGKRIWCFSHQHRQQEYYPLVAASLSGGVTLVDYPRQCTTPNDLAMNPATKIPELAMVGHRGPTQDLFILFLNHY